MEDSYLAKITERLFLSPIKLAIVPEVVDMFLPVEGVAHNIAIVKINKSYPGQAYKVANAFWGAGQMMFNKIMVIVSSNIDIRNPQAVAEEITIHFNPESDMYIGRGPLDVLDHASVKAGVGGKMLIDATEKMPEEAETITPVPLPDAALLAKAFNEFPEAEYSLNTSLLLRGISALIVAVDKSRGISAKQFASQLAAVSKELLPKIILYVDHELNPEDIPRVCWYATANIDPARDCFYVDADNIRLPCLMIDGTRKSFPMDSFNRPWPNIVVSDEDTIRAIDAKWESFNIGKFIQSPSRSIFQLGSGSEVVMK
jgi:4-hydroxy-3-polyprenylbenzoate decarboxylase